MSFSKRWLLSCLAAGMSLGALGCHDPVGPSLDASVPGFLDAATPAPDSGTPGASDAFVPPDAALAPLQVTSAPTILGTVEVPIDLTLTVEGGEPPYSWSGDPASPLPDGLLLLGNGVLRGTPHASGRFPFVVTVSDASGLSASATLELVVTEPILNDSCLAATPLDVSSGSAIVVATLEGAQADGAAAACGLPSAQDVFYTFELTARSFVTAALSRKDTAVVALLPADCPIATEPLACHASADGMLEPGKYLVAVAGAGPFRLHLTARPPTGDSCAEVIPLDVSSGSVRIRGNFDGAAADFVSRCSQGRDRVYSFELATAADIRVEGLTDYARASLRPGFCPGGEELECSERYDLDLRAQNLAAGPYTLVFTEVGTSDFGAVLTISPPTTPPANDTCDTATELTFVDGVATMAGTLLGASQSFAPGYCGDENYGDVFYSLDLPSPSTVSVIQTSHTMAMVQLLSGPCEALVPVTAAIPETEICQFALPAGRHYLRVGDYAYGCGPHPATFSYTVIIKEEVPAPANDTCSAPETIALTSGVNFLSGNMVAAARDYELPCLTGSFPEIHDRVYKLVLPTRADLQFSNGDYWTSLAVAVMEADCETGASLMCNPQIGHTRAKLWGIGPGSYWLILQAYNTSSNSCWPGDFNLVLSVTPTVQPVNDNCSAPTEYVFAGPGLTAHISGSTGGGANDFTKVDCWDSALKGPDVVYAITLQSSASLRISSGFGPAFYLTSSCGSASALACSSANNSDTLVFTSGILSAGTYYLVVEDANASWSNWDLDFDLLVETL